MYTDNLSCNKSKSQGVAHIRMHLKLGFLRQWRIVVFIPLGFDYPFKLASECQFINLNVKLTFLVCTI